VIRRSSRPQVQSPASIGSCAGVLPVAPHPAISAVELEISGRMATTSVCDLTWHSGQPSRLTGKGA